MRVSRVDHAGQRGAVRVLHVGPDMSARGGIAIVLSGYAANRALFESLGVEFSFLATCGRSGVTRLLAFPLAWLNLVGAIVFGKTDIVHFHSSIRGSLLRKWLLAATCIVLRQKFVVHLHSGATERHLEHLPAVLRAAVGVMWTHAAGIICLSYEMQGWLTRQWACSADKARLIYNGLSDPLCGDAPLHPSVDAPVALFLGKLSEAKGLTVLLRAVQRLRMRGHSFRLLVGGNGDEHAFRHEVEQLGLSDTVDYLGWVSGKQKALLLASADIFVLPSRSEGFPVSIVEAMAFGASIVSTNIPGVIDAITHRREGLLVPPDDVDALSDALAALITTPELRVQLSVAARRRFIERFTIQRTAEELARAYQQVTQ